jgi:hypothetical protein
MLPEYRTDIISNVVYDAIRTLTLLNEEFEMPLYKDMSDDDRVALKNRVNKILSDPRAGDSTFHNEWLARMSKEGWSYGRVYDEKKKHNPEMVQFHLLPPNEQMRERLFRAMVLGMSRY